MNKKKDPKPDNTKVLQSIESVKAPSALQKKIDERAMRFMNWEDSAGEFAGKPRDVMDAPGMGDLLDIYGSAESLAQQKQIGNPANAFGAGANPGFSKQLEQQGAMDRYNVRASGLNEGLQGLKAQAYGMADQSIGNEMNRNQGYASGLLQHQQNYYNRPRQTPLWERIAGLAIGGLSAARPGGI